MLIDAVVEPDAVTLQVREAHGIGVRHGHGDIACRGTAVEQHHQDDVCETHVQYGQPFTWMGRLELVSLRHIFPFFVER